MQMTNEIRKELEPVVTERVAIYKASKIPEAELEAWAWEIVEEALPKYDPSRYRTKPPSLGLFVRQHLKKMRRRVIKRVTTEHNIARIPEHRAYNITAFKKAEADLWALHGKKPCRCSLADRLGWSVKEVERMYRDLHPATAWPELLQRLGGAS